MKNIAVMALKPDMVLGEDIMAQGNVVYASGTKLTQTIIERISRYGIMCVTVWEEVDFATTHYEKIRFDESFQAFEATYNDVLMQYKSLMYAVVNNGLFVPDHVFLGLYHAIYSKISSGTMLLDYLYNMMPNEDELTLGHCLNSALLAGTVADWLGMDETAKNTLILCGFYYDIGKLKLPYDLLWKSGKLTDEEFKIIQSHPVIGYSIVRNFRIDEHIKNTVIMHHERLDGSGYPYHMQGQKIDVFARYMAIIDAYIAMASPRSYRNALTPLQILGNLESDMSKFDIELLMPLLQRIADTQIGMHIQTNDGQTWEVLIIHPNKVSRPILKNEKNEIIDLAEHPELKIVKMM